MFSHSLPKGWRREEIMWEENRSLNHNSIIKTIYWSPEGKKITTKKELMKELGSEWDAPECFDFKTGQFSSELIKKKQERDAKKNEYFLKTGHRPIDYDFELPVRRAQWCGEMPLKIITHYPKNKVEREYPTREKEDSVRPIAPVRQRPTQLLSEKRLENIKPREVDGFQTGGMCLPDSIKPSLPDIFDDGPLLSRMSSQLLNSKLPLQGQKEILEVKDVPDRDNTKDMYKTLLNADHVQPLCTPVKILDQEILRQEDTVRKTQAALAELMKQYRSQQQSTQSSTILNSL